MRAQQNERRNKKEFSKRLKRKERFVYLWQKAQHTKQMYITSLTNPIETCNNCTEDDLFAYLHTNTHSTQHIHIVMARRRKVHMKLCVCLAFYVRSNVSCVWLSCQFDAVRSQERSSHTNANWPLNIILGTQRIESFFFSKIEEADKNKIAAKSGDIYYIYRREDKGKVHKIMHGVQLLRIYRPGICLNVDVHSIRDRRITNCSLTLCVCVCALFVFIQRLSQVDAYFDVSQVVSVEHLF